MLIDFFYTLRSAKLPVSVKEYLMLLEALQAGVVGPNSGALDDDDGEISEGAYKIDDFYFLSRTILKLLQRCGDGGRLHQRHSARMAAQKPGTGTEP
jgi:uncharacterized protein with von Willebrand factor type A (vWA) domain